jgi:hypothetical protein
LRNTKKAAGLLELPECVTKLQQSAMEWAGEWARKWATVVDDSPDCTAPAVTHAQEPGI